MIRRYFYKDLDRIASQQNIPADYEEAYQFAKTAHQGQKRKGLDKEYITHPVAVFNLIRQIVPLQKEYLIAALLHDVVEDTQVTVEEIELKFGIKVRTIVEILTKPKDQYNRRQLYHQKLLGASSEIKLVKVFDRVHNLMEIEGLDKSFARVYIEESKDFYYKLACELGETVQGIFLVALKSAVNVLGG